MFIKIWFHTSNEFLHVNLDSFPSNSLTFFYWRIWFFVIWSNFRNNAQPLNKSFTMNVKLWQKKLYVVYLHYHPTSCHQSYKFNAICDFIIIIDRFIDRKYHFTFYSWIMLIRFLALNHLLYFPYSLGIVQDQSKMDGSFCSFLLDYFVESHIIPKVLHTTFMAILV
jgi:hypothetical protein